MDLFGLRNHLVDDSATYVRSLLRVRDQRIQDYVEQSVDSGYLWPDPIVQLNPTWNLGLSFGPYLQIVFCGVREVLRSALLERCASNIALPFL
jgi:hypothetical protein